MEVASDGGWKLRDEGERFAKLRLDLRAERDGLGFDLLSAFVVREANAVLAVPWRSSSVAAGIDAEPRIRWPRVILQVFAPAISNRITCSPSSATIQRMGRLKRGPFAPPVRTSFSPLGTVIKPGPFQRGCPAVARPSTRFTGARSSSCLAERADVAPFFLAKPSAAVLPGSQWRTSSTTCSESGVRSGRSEAQTEESASRVVYCELRAEQVHLAVCSRASGAISAESLWC